MMMTDFAHRDMERIANLETIDVFRRNLQNHIYRVWSTLLVRTTKLPSNGGVFNGFNFIKAHTRFYIKSKPCRTVTL